MKTTDEVFQQALHLSPEERADLAHRLLVSLEPEDGPGLADLGEGNDEWHAEMGRRLDMVERGEYDAKDWREVIAELREELHNRRRT